VTAKIIQSPVVDEMSQSFLEYAMSVIVARAIPDVRDGLKPVHRRILYTMHSLGIRPTGPHKKSARVVGDTMGRLHPHGDSAIYLALVRLAQDFSMSLPTVDGHGNFGTLDDGPAASRYTECRLSPAGAAMLEGIEENTVDFEPSYDASEQEPTVLPSAFPNLLVNGGSGIAVGMASMLPPHNLVEVVAGLAAMLDNPKITLEEMMRHIPGPDLPTGGQIFQLDGVYNAYNTGQGRFRIRGTASVIDVTARKRGIEITELPYQIGSEKIIKKIKELVNNKRLNSIADVKDLTDRKNKLRIIVECKTGHNPEAVLAELYNLTDLEVSYSMNAVVLVGGLPQTLGLLDLSRYYLDHRRDVITRRTQFRRHKAASRLLIVEGLLIALASIEEVIATIKASRDTATARKNLIKRFKLEQVQADNILEMPLRRLTNLSVTELRAEAKELTSTIRELDKILGSPKVLTQLIKSELINIADTFGVPRRTRLSNEVPVIAAPTALPDEPCVLGLTPSTISRLVPAPVKGKMTHSDLFSSVLVTTTHAAIGVITTTGRLHRIEAMTILESAPKTSGPNIAEYIALDPGEAALGLFTLPLSAPVALATARGTLKRLDPKSLPTRFPTDVIKLEEGDTLIGAVVAPDEASLVLVTSDAQLLRTPAGKIRPQGRTSGGVAGMRLDEQSKASVIYLGRAHEGDILLLASSGNGDAGVKATPIMEYPEKGRGGAGVRCAKLRVKELAVTRALVADPSDVLLFTGKAQVDVPSTAKRDGATSPSEEVTALGLTRPRVSV
jgi:DNA gyrase subunit A